MNLKLLPVLLVSFAITNTQAQNLCNLPYKKGTKINFNGENSPHVLDYEPKFYYLKKKEQDKVREQFNAEVATGKIKGKTYDFFLTCTDAKNLPDGNMYEFEYVIPGAKYYTYSVCRNDTLTGIKSKTGSFSVNSSGDTIGYALPGTTTYPLKMKVGDVLPVATDLNFTFPTDMEIRYKRQILDHVTNYETSDYYVSIKYFKEVTRKVNYTLQFSAPTVTYRYVEGEEQMTINGKSYKAFRIQLVLQTKVEDMITNVTADDILTKWAVQFSNRMISTGINKNADLKLNGHEWFVPELGGVVKTEIFNADGSPQIKTRLTSIQ
jgi:hypothetical protein